METFWQIPLTILEIFHQIYLLAREIYWDFSIIPSINCLNFIMVPLSIEFYHAVCRELKDCNKNQDYVIKNLMARHVLQLPVFAKYMCKQQNAAEMVAEKDYI